MAITHSWKFLELKCKVGPDEDDHSNVVYEVVWQITANDCLGHIARYNGETTLERSDGDPWIAYENITAANVQSWVEASMGAADVAQMKVGLARNIAEQATPTQTTNSTMPWE